MISFRNYRHDHTAALEQERERHRGRCLCEEPDQSNSAVKGSCPRSHTTGVHCSFISLSLFPGLLLLLVLKHTTTIVRLFVVAAIRTAFLRDLREQHLNSALSTDLNPLFDNSTSAAESAFASLPNARQRPVSSE